MKQNSIKNLIKMIRAINVKDQTASLALKSATLGLLLGVNWLEEAIAAGMTATEVVNKIGATLSADEQKKLVQELDSVIKAAQTGQSVNPISQDALAQQLAELAQAAGISQAELMELLQNAGLPAANLAAFETKIASVYVQAAPLSGTELADAAQGSGAEGILPIAGIGLGPVLGVGVGVAALAGGGGGDAAVPPVPNSAPTVLNVQNAALVEDASAPNLSAVVSVGFRDVNVSDRLTYTQVASSDNTLGGTLTLLSSNDSGVNMTDGSVSFTYTVSNALTQSLAEGEVATESFLITATDDSGASVTQTVTVTITGKNDAPTLQVVGTDGSSITLLAADVDNGAVLNLEVAVGGVSSLTNEVETTIDLVAGIAPTQITLIAEDQFNAKGSAETTLALGTNSADSLDASQLSESAIVYGFDGNDTITSSNQNDVIFGGDGHDLIEIVGGQNTIDGGDGFDRVVYSAPGTTLSFGAGDGSFLVEHGSGLTDELTSVDVIEADGRSFFLVGNGGYATIQEAVDAANDGDVIVLAAGQTFVGDISINKGVSIIGAANAGVDGSSASRGDESVIDGKVTITSTSKVVIDGVKFLNNDTYTLDIADNYVAVKVLAHASSMSGGHEIKNSVFLRDPVSDPSGFNSSLFAGSNNQPTHRAIELAKVSAGEAITISNNLITSTNEYVYAGDSWRSGVYSNGGAGETTISGNTFENVRGALNLDDFGSSVFVTMNNFASAGSAISIGGVADASDLATISGNTFGRVDTDFNAQGLGGAQPVVLDIAAVGGPAVGTQPISGIEEPEFFVALTGAGNDSVVGSSGNDVITTNAGNDTITGGSGNDVINAGSGIDTVIFTEDVAFDSTGSAFSVSAGGEGTDLLTGVEKVIAANGNFLLVGHGGFTTIQQAVDAASSGDTILVAAGTYNENVVINKSNISLLSIDGAETTFINGISGQGSLGTVQLNSGVSNVTLGDTGKGFTILGLNGNGAIENAAVYMVGASHSGHVIQGNVITARGDAGLLSDFGGAVTNVLIDSNTFNGQTFVGTLPDQVSGFSTQFDLGNNVPRQLVTLGNGGGTTASSSSNITFSNNEVSGIAGGGVLGNTLVTIDASNSKVLDNLFDGFTVGNGFALRMRRDGAEVKDNTLDHSDGGSSGGFFFQNQTGPASNFSGNELIGGTGNDSVFFTPGNDQIDGGEPLTGLDIDTLFVTGAVSVQINDGSFTVTGVSSGVDTLVNMEKVVASNGTFLLVGNGGFSTIQAAIDAAVDGDTVLVAAGQYQENLMISKGIKLIGVNAGIDGTGMRGDEAVIDGTILINSATAVTFDGFKVLNNEAVGTGRVDIKSLTLASGADHVVANSVFESSVFGGADAVMGIRDTAIFTNTLSTGNIQIKNNFITSTEVNAETGTAFGAFGTAAWGRGIWIDGGSVKVTIDSNTLFSTRTGINLEEYSDTLRVVTGNDFTLAGTGISLGSPVANTPIAITAIQDNVFEQVGTTFNFRNLNEDVSFNALTTMNTVNGAGFVILTGSGNDTVTGGAGNDTINTGTGVDTVTYSGTPLTVTGVTGAFTVTSAAGGSDSLVGVEKIVSGAQTFLLVGNGGFATIQAAVAAAQDGQTIVVASGTYSGVVTIDNSLNNLKIIGLEGAVLNGAFNVQGSGTTIDGMSIQNGALISGSKTAIYLNAPDVTLTNLTMSNPVPFDPNVFGIESVFGANTSGLLISNVNSSGFQTGLYLNPGAEGAVISDSSFVGTRAGAGIDGVQNISLTDNTFNGGVIDLELFNIDGLEFSASGNQFVNGTIESGQYGAGQAGVLNFGISTFDGVEYGALQIGTPNSDMLNTTMVQDLVAGGAGSDTFVIQATGLESFQIQDNGDNVVSDGDVFTGRFDVVADFSQQDGDLLNFSAVNTLAAQGNAIAGLGADQFQLIRGDFLSGAFTASQSGADTLIAFDAGSNDAGVVLLGVESLDQSSSFVV